MSAAISRSCEMEGYLQQASPVAQPFRALVILDDHSQIQDFYFKYIGYFFGKVKLQSGETLIGSFRKYPKGKIFVHLAINPQTKRIDWDENRFFSLKEVTIINDLVLWKEEMAPPTLGEEVINAILSTLGEKAIALTKKQENLAVHPHVKVITNCGEVEGEMIQIILRENGRPWIIKIQTHPTLNPVRISHDFIRGITLFCNRG